MSFKRIDLLLLLALLIGADYFIEEKLGSAGAFAVVAKGAGVALLAVWAAIQARNADGWLIALVMALGATGDVLIETMGLSEGALAFLVGHVIAVGLYLRNRRDDPGWLAAVAGFAGLAAWVSMRAIKPDPGLALYVFGLSLMVGTAILSRFPHAVRIGAVLFFVSDWLIFLRMGPLHGSIVPDLLVWPCYLIGQVLIAWGVVSTLREEPR